MSLSSKSNGTPHPGDLRYRVEIGYTENTINENGYPDEKDIILCKTWASAVDTSDRSFRSADTMNTEAVTEFTIRYRADVQPGMWVKFREQKWYITELNEYSFRRNYLGLKASVAKGVSG